MCACTCSERVFNSDSALPGMASSPKTHFGHKLPNPRAEENCRRIENVQRAQWLRAAILGANDGLLSTTSLMLGIGAAKEDRWSMILSGLAGAVAGACSMAVGEFVSVSTQRDIEKATPNIELGGEHEHHGMKLSVMTATAAASIKEGKPGDTNLGTRQVPCPLLTHERPAVILEQRLATTVLSPIRSPLMKVITEDAKANAIVMQEDHSEEALPNPYKAAAASSLAFLCGSFVPLVSGMFVTQNIARVVVIAVAASIALAVFGGIGAYLGGSPVRISTMRVVVGGWIAMAITYGLLKPFDRDHDDRNGID